MDNIVSTLKEGDDAHGPMALPTMHLSQESSPPTSENDTPGPLAIGVTAVLSLLLLWAFIRWRKRPLPMERLPEVARRQRMKGL
jgi:hypothetical protein